MNPRYQSWLKTIIAKWGSLEAYKDAQRQYGAKGGKAKNPNKGFGSSKKLAQEGGHKSSRAK